MQLNLIVVEFQLKFKKYIFIKYGLSIWCAWLCSQKTNVPTYKCTIGMQYA